MELLWIILGVCIAFIALLLLCFFLVFYIPTRHPERDPYPVPKGKDYEPYHNLMKQWIKDTDQLPQQPVEIQSFDGLTLRALYFEANPGGPVELMFHGYRGSARRDLAGGVGRRLTLGHNVFLIDQRAGGHSDGHITTFGIRESRDCLDWVQYAIHRFGPDCKIILTGISMGAATVLMAAGNPLPPQVVGVLADCGYTSAPDIMRTVIRALKLPVWPLYPLIRLSGRLFGGFDVEDASPVQAMTRCKVPVIFYHGEADTFVPCRMSHENYAACAAPKRLHTTPGAGHGMSYPADAERYVQALREMHGVWNLPLPETAKAKKPAL